MTGWIGLDGIGYISDHYDHQSTASGAKNATLHTERKTQKSVMCACTYTPQTPTALLNVEMSRNSLRFDDLRIYMRVRKEPEENLFL